MKPATELPWLRIDEYVESHNKETWVARADLDQDAAYIVHACNAYPKLVEALMFYASLNIALSPELGNNARQLLRELGKEA